MNPRETGPADETAQRWSSDVYEAHARFVSEYGAAVVEWLAPRPGERILDLGCGDGVLTAEIAAAGALVTGVDASPAFVEAARVRGIDAVLGDGVALPFEAAFDAVFSNAALHWMPDASAVAASVHRALKPGGRFVAEFGGHGNVAAIVTALIAAADRFGLDRGLAHPWYFPTAEAHRALLEAAGFEVEKIVLVPRPTRLPSDMAGWLTTFREPLFQAAGARAGEVRATVLDLLAPSLRDAAGVWTADYVRLRFFARRRG
jgi:SAM-dependent methyltransferase